MSTQNNFHTVRVWARVNEHIKNLLKQRATDEGISESELVNKAISMYLTKDVLDESLLIAKMSDIARQVNRLSHKVDVQQKLELDWYQYFFLYAPSLPKDQKELAILFDNANKDVQNFLLNFRHRAQKMKSLIETIFGDMLEEDGKDTQ